MIPRWIVIGGVTVILVVLAASVNPRDNFLAQTGNIFIQTFRDSFGKKPDSPVLELDLARESRGAPAEFVLGSEETDSTTSERPAQKGGNAKKGNSSASQSNTEPPQTDAAGISQNAPPVLPSEKTPASPVCDFARSGVPHHRVILNEIAWMGREGAATDEWMELKNVSGEPLSLTGWRVVNESESVKIIFEAGESLPAGGLPLLERTDDNSVPGVLAHRVYAGALANNGEWLKLFDSDCALADEIDARAGWGAFGGDNATKQTLERSADLSWHTSSEAHGTPQAENSQGTAVSPPPQAPTSTPEASSYRLRITKVGNGSGLVRSAGGEIDCGSVCEHAYAPDTALNLVANPAPGSVFDGWSGACTRDGACTFTVREDVVVSAAFSTVPSPPPPPPPSSLTALINEIFYDAEGSDTGKEFIEFLNPTSADIDMNGWKLTRDAVPFATFGFEPEDKTVIPRGGYLLVGFNNYAGTPPADIVRAASLRNTAATITLLDANGVQIDAVHYDKAQDGLSEGESFERASPSESVFARQPNPNPQNSRGN